MCNSVTGTVEASSGRASQRKPGQGLIAVTLRGFFLFTVCQNSDSCRLLFSPRSLSLSEFFQISCFPVLEVLYSDRSSPSAPSSHPHPPASALLTCAFSLESSLCWQRHHNTEEPLPWMLQGAVGWNIEDGFASVCFTVWLVPVCIYRGTGGRPELHINDKWQQPSYNIYIFI